MKKLIRECGVRIISANAGGHELSKTQCILNVTPQTYEPTACRCGFEVEFGWSRSSGGPIRERFWCETHHTEITDEYSDA
jgi:hypothetical protein